MDRLDMSLFLFIFSFLVYYLLSIDSWYLVTGVIFLVAVFIFRIRIFIVLLILFLVLSRVFIYDYQTYDRFSDLIASEKTFEFKVTVCGEPDIRLKHVNYIVCVQSVGTELVDFEKIKNRRLILKNNLYPRFDYGDELFLFGSVEEPFETNEFSYKEYLKIFKVDGVLKPKSTVQKIGSNNSLKRKIYDLKFLILESVEKGLDEPYASLVNGLILGSRKGFTDDLNDKLAITGLTHIVAVSGYNVSLVILFIERSLFFIPRHIRFYILVLAIAVFAILAGLSASVVRACIMGVISVVVIQYGFSQSVLRALLLSAVVMTFYNPAFLFVDLGFQLSFFSTLGILYLVKMFEFKFLPSSFGLRDAFTLTVASQLATLPTVLYYFGNLSLISPIANVLVAPMLPIMMLFGFLIFVFNKVIWISQILTYLTTSIGYLFFYILDQTASYKYSMIKIPTSSLIVVLFVYLILLLLIIRSRKSFES